MSCDRGEGFSHRQASVGGNGPLKLVLDSPPSVLTRVPFQRCDTEFRKTRITVMESSLGLQTSMGLQPHQTYCVAPTPESPKSYSSGNIQVFENNSIHESGDISIITTVPSSSDLLAVPPAPRQEQKENKNLGDLKTMISMPLNAFQNPIENDDPPLLHFEISDIHQLLDIIDPPDPEEKPACENYNLGNNSLTVKNSVKKLDIVGCGTEPNNDFPGSATLVKAIPLPQVLNSFEDLDQSKGSKSVKTENTRAITFSKVQEISSAPQASSDQARKNKHTASEPISGAPKAKTKPKIPDCMCLGEVGICNAAASDHTPANMARHSNSKPQKAASSRNSKAESQGQEKRKRNKDNTSEKAEESQPSGKKVKAEEKPTIPRMKRKRNQPELTPESFEQPRTLLGMHMLASVQVFHALGKKPEKKTEPFSFRALGNSSNPKGSRSPPHTKRWLDTCRVGQVSEKSEVKHQKRDGREEKESSSASQNELPPPGKVKLVPLPFLNLDKPPARPLPRRPLSLALHRSALAKPAQPGSNMAQPNAVSSSRPSPASVTEPPTPTGPLSNNAAHRGSINPAQPASHSAQTTAVNPSRPTPASSTGPVRPAWSLSTNPPRPGLTNTTCSSVPQSAAPRPVPYKPSWGSSFQREPIRTAVTKPQSPPKPQYQHPPWDLALQPLPWRKPSVPEPVISTPITDEQRPEREGHEEKSATRARECCQIHLFGESTVFHRKGKRKGNFSILWLCNVTDACIARPVFNNDIFP